MAQQTEQKSLHQYEHFKNEDSFSTASLSAQYWQGPMFRLAQRRCKRLVTLKEAQAEDVERQTELTQVCELATLIQKYGYSVLIMINAEENGLVSFPCSQ